MDKIQIVEITQDQLPINCFGVSFIVVSNRDMDTVHEYISSALDEWHGYTLDGYICPAKEGFYASTGRNGYRKIEELEVELAKANNVIRSQNESILSRNIKINELKAAKKEALDGWAAEFARHDETRRKLSNITKIADQPSGFKPAKVEGAQ